MMGEQWASLVAVEQVQKSMEMRLPVKELQNGTAATFVDRPNEVEFVKVVHKEASNTRKGASLSDQHVPLALKRFSPNVCGAVGVVGSCGAGVEDSGDAVACTGASKYKQYSGNVPPSKRKGSVVVWSRGSTTKKKARSVRG
jgi:hypothetical protein